MLSNKTIYKKIKRKVELKLKQLGPLPKKPPFCAIFLFHTIEKYPQPWTHGHRYVTKFDHFKNQIDYIKKNFQILTSTELIENLKSDNFKNNIAAIHFDDGFQSYAEMAVPYLREQKIPSTIFLINSVIEGKVPIRNKLAYCLNSEGRRPLLDQWQKFLDQEGVKILNLKKMDNAAILAWAKRNVSEKMDKAIEKIYEEWIQKENLPHPFLDKKNVLSLKKEPYVEFGSHTLNHPILSQLSSEQQHYEIIEGHENMEKLLEMGLIHFAYPHGGEIDFNEKSKDLVRKLSRVTAYSSYGGVNFKYNPTNLKRISLSNQTAMGIKSAILSSL